MEELNDDKGIPIAYQQCWLVDLLPYFDHPEYGSKNYEGISQGCHVFFREEQD